MAKMHPEGPTDLLWGDGSEFESSLCHFKVWTPDPDTLSLPSTFLFKIHYRFATALHLFHVEDVAALGWPPQSRKGTTTLSNSSQANVPGPIDFRAQHVGRIFLFLWLFIPFWIRIQCYFLLIRIGRSLYGRGPRHWVYPLPFGLVAKECINSGPNEPNALRLVDKYTSVPAPRLIDAGEYHGKTYLVMTRVPGQELSKVFHLMSYPERDRLVEDLKSCVAQLRKIPNHTPYLICDTLGGPVVDHRVPDKSGGPFNTEADFTKYLCLGCSPAEALGDVPVPQGHRSYFTHSDFDYSNLLIENGRLSGIVDWECAGYKPEYWEFTKALYTFDGGARGALFRRVFDNKYEQELAAERISRRFAPFGCL